MRIRTGHLKLILVGPVAALVFAASSAGGTATRAPAVASATAKPKIALFVAILANAYEASLVAGAKAEAAKEGASLTILDPNNDPQKQVAQCQAALASKRYNIFLLKSVAGTTTLNCAKQAIAAGIKVVPLDTPTGPRYTLQPQVKGATTPVLSLPQTNGKALLTMLQQACAGKNPCKVAYMYGSVVFGFFKVTKDVVLAGIKKMPNVQLVFQGTWNFDPSLGVTLTEQALTTAPDLNVLLSDSDTMDTPAIKVLKEQNKLSQVTVIGGGGACQGVRAIKAGEQFGTSALYPRTIGRLGVQYGVKAFKGEPVPPPKDAAFLTPLGPVITKKNVDKFKCEWG